MGGYGSGRINRGASKSDEFHKLDLSSFEREWFEYGRSGNATWSRGGQKTASIGYVISETALRLTYTVGSGGTKTEIDERFFFAFTRQKFGGKRRWILCKCGRRCRVLYGGKYFRCRQCYRLTYESQYERFRVPGMATAEKVRDRLGMRAGFAYPFGAKPKGMHWRTYRAFQARDWAMGDAIERALCGRWGF